MSSTATIADVFDDWHQEDAELLRTDVRGVEYNHIDVAEATSRATELLGIEAPDDGAFVVPLFATDEPVPTNEYVLYKPESDQIGWYDTGFGQTGTKRFTDCERLETYVIGHRLRFWLPDDRVQVELEVDESELPADRVNPASELGAAEQDAFFDELRDFVRSERETARESNWDDYTELGLEAAMDRNRLSGPFLHVRRVAGLGGGTAFTFQMVEDEDEDGEVDLRDDERLFEGNYCIVDAETGGEHFPVEAELLSVDDPMVTIQPDWDGIDDENAVRKLLNQDGLEIWLHELLNPVPYERRLMALDQVEKDDRKRELLTGTRPVEFSVNKYSTPEPAIELNDYQRLALIWADGANDVVCIHGPPGTGKTRTLTAYIERAVSRGKSVLVTAHSNQAVDNLLVGDSTRHSIEEGTLHAMAQDPDTDLSIARAGSNSRNRVVQSSYMNRSISSADVVAATTSGASRFDPDRFDVAVVDEATQASRPATAIALNCARKLVLAGDHKQLPPYSADETMQEEDMHISLFEHLLNRYGDRISVLLRKQYRMNEEIATFPNSAFYDGTLETADRNRTWTVDDLKPIMGIDIQGDEQRQTQGNSYYNLDEAEAVARQVELLARNDLDPENIGVITAYSGQIGVIGSRINRLDTENSHRVTVDTVDSFQGGERDAIIVSFVRSNPAGHSGFLEFPEEGPRRLNVALTRARKRLVLVGDWSTLGTVAPHRTPEESCANLYDELAEHLRSNERMLD